MKCWHRFWKPHDEIHDFGVMMNVFLFFCSLSSHFPPFSQKPKRFKLKTFLMRDTIRCDTASTLTILGFSRKSKDGNDKWKRTIIGMSSSSASTPEMGRSLHPPGWPFEALHSSFERLLTTSTATTCYAFCALHASSSLKIRNKNLNIFETWFHWSSIPLFHLPPSVWLLNDFFLCEKGFIFFFTNNNQHQIDHQPANIVNFRASRVLCVRTLAIRRIINSAWGSLREGTLRDGFPKKN